MCVMANILLDSPEYLKKLVANVSSSVELRTYVKEVILQPFHLRDIKGAVGEILKSSLLRYDASLDGLLLGYQKLRLLSDKAACNSESSQVSVKIQADFYVFRPRIGNTYSAVVHKLGVAHIGCLLYDHFNISLPISPEKLGLLKSLTLQTEVTFIMEEFDLSGELPYFRGQLATISSKPAEQFIENKSGKKKKNDVGSGTMALLQTSLNQSSIFNTSQNNLKKEVAVQEKKKKKSKLSKLAVTQGKVSSTPTAEKVSEVKAEAERDLSKHVKREKKKRSLSLKHTKSCEGESKNSEDDEESDHLLTPFQRPKEGSSSKVNVTDDAREFEKLKPLIRSLRESPLKELCSPDDSSSERFGDNLRNIDPLTNYKSSSNSQQHEKSSGVKASQSLKNKCSQKKSILSLKSNSKLQQNFTKTPQSDESRPIFSFKQAFSGDEASSEDSDVDVSKKDTSKKEDPAESSLSSSDVEDETAKPLPSQPRSSLLFPRSPRKSASPQKEKVSNPIMKANQQPKSPMKHSNLFSQLQTFDSTSDESDEEEEQNAPTKPPEDDSSSDESVADTVEKALPSRPILDQPEDDSSDESEDQATVKPPAKTQETSADYDNLPPAESVQAPLTNQGYSSSESSDSDKDQTNQRRMFSTSQKINCGQNESSSDDDSDEAAAVNSNEKKLEKSICGTPVPKITLGRLEGETERSSSEDSDDSREDAPPKLPLAALGNAVPKRGGSSQGSSNSDDSSLVGKEEPNSASVPVITKAREGVEKSKSSSSDSDSDDIFQHPAIQRLFSLKESSKHQNENVEKSKNEPTIPVSQKKTVLNQTCLDGTIRSPLACSTPTAGSTKMDKKGLLVQSLKKQQPLEVKKSSGKAVEPRKEKTSKKEQRQSGKDTPDAVSSAQTDAVSSETKLPKNSDSGFEDLKVSTDKTKKKKDKKYVPELKSEEEGKQSKPLEDPHRLLPEKSTFNEAETPDILSKTSDKEKRLKKKEEKAKKIGISSGTTISDSNVKGSSSEPAKEDGNAKKKVKSKKKLGENLRADDRLALVMNEKEILVPKVTTTETTVAVNTYPNVTDQKKSKKRKVDEVKPPVGTLMDSTKQNDYVPESKKKKLFSGMVEDSSSIVNLSLGTERTTQTNLIPVDRKTKQSKSNTDSSKVVRSKPLKEADVNSGKNKKIILFGETQQISDSRDKPTAQVKKPKKKNKNLEVESGNNTLINELMSNARGALSDEGIDKKKKKKVREKKLDCAETNQLPGVPSHPVVQENKTENSKGKKSKRRNVSDTVSKPVVANAGETSSPTPVESLPPSKTETISTKKRKTVKEPKNAETGVPIEVPLLLPVDLGGPLKKKRTKGPQNSKNKTEVLLGSVAPVKKPRKKKEKFELNWDVDELLDNSDSDEDYSDVFKRILDKVKKDRGLPETSESVPEEGVKEKSSKSMKKVEVKQTEGKCNVLLSGGKKKKKTKHN